MRLTPAVSVGAIYDRFGSNPAIRSTGQNHCAEVLGPCLMWICRRQCRLCARPTRSRWRPKTGKYPPCMDRSRHMRRCLLRRGLRPRGSGRRPRPCAQPRPEPSRRLRGGGATGAGRSGGRCLAADEPLAADQGGAAGRVATPGCCLLTERSGPQWPPPDSGWQRPPSWEQSPTIHTATVG
jgi:hypothetical protein